MKPNKIIKNSFIILNFLFSCVIITSSLIDFKFDIQAQQFSEKFNIRTSDYWNLTGSSIFIDDADPNYNWSKTSNDYSWCSGTGTWNDPYMIENVTIDGQYSVSCITIQNSSVYFTIRNCTLHSASSNYDAGIKLVNVNNSLLINNTFTNNAYAGILLWENCINNTIEDNILYFEDVYCISLYKSCHNNRILNNRMEDSGGYNIYFYENNNDNIIHGNYITGSGDQQGAGSSIYFHNECDNNIISNNNLSHNYYEAIIFGTYCDHNIIKNNRITNNEYSYAILLVQYCNYNTFFNNTIKNNGLKAFSDCYGIWFYEDCDNNNITQNVIVGNDYYGIYLTIGSGNNTISENICGNDITSDQEIGIYLENSDDNIIVGNFFRNNTWRSVDINANTDNCLIYQNFFVNSGIVHARDLGTNNNWNSSTIGNYWDNYTGVDANQDGIGDTPHIFGNIIDYLPIKDDDAPSITIIEPETNQLYGVNPPSFTVEIRDPYLDEMWYSVNNGQDILINNNSTIDQTIWSLLVDGNYNITFYANDTFDHTTSESVIIIKDTLNPTLDIISPPTGIIIENATLDFIVEIFDDHLDKMWYTINSGITKYFFTANSTIPEWLQLPNGPVTITFYANDTAGNGFSKYTTVIKQIPDEGNGNGGSVSGYNIVVVFTILIASIGLILVLTKNKKKIV